MLHELCEKFLSIRTEAQTYTYPFDGSAELSWTEQDKRSQKQPAEENKGLCECVWVSHEVKLWIPAAISNNMYFPSAFILLLHPHLHPKATNKHTHTPPPLVHSVQSLFLMFSIFKIIMF